MSWGRAWRGALAYLGWSIVWGLAGIALMVAGIAVIFMTILGAASSFYYGYSLPWGGIIMGIVLIAVGGIVTSLGQQASFFKINSEIISEETKRQLEAQKPALCPTCGSQLRFIDNAQRWYCDKEGKYL